MLKVTQRWTLNFPEFVKDIEDNPSVVSHILLDFLQEILYTWPTETVAYERLLDIAYEHNIPVTIVTPYPKTMPPLLDFNEPKYKRINMIYMPEFWFTRTYNMWTLSQGNMDMNLAKNVDMRDMNFGENNNNFNYLYICTNNIAKRHRCLVMDLLAKHNLIDRGAISWRDIIHAFDEDRHLYPDLLDSQRGNYPYQYWTPKRMFLDYDLSYFHQETVPEQFKESFMQLVTESDDEIVFFSEKTATPILLNKIFLVAGSQYHHRELNSMGFVNYDEIFDYSFDTEPDNHNRYEKIIENVKRLSVLSREELAELYKKLWPKIVHNKRVAMGYVNNLPKEVLPFLDILKNETEYTGPLNMFL
jgi:hypothetical protein